MLIPYYLNYSQTSTWEFSPFLCQTDPQHIQGCDHSNGVGSLVENEATSATGCLCRRYETPLEAQNCWCLQIQENFKVSERCCMSSSFVVSHDPIISVQKKLYTHIIEFEHFTNTLWQGHMLDSHWWQNSHIIWTYHSYIIFVEYIKYWSSQNLRLITACWKSVIQLLFLNSKIICTFFQQNVDQNKKHCWKQWYKVETLSDVWEKHLQSHSGQ
jgi:hypothetical protein